MKVKEVYFEKLFSLEKYNNERIGLRAEVEQGEDADKVIGKLNLKIADVEECLETYRRLLSEIYYASQQFDDKQTTIRHTQERMKDMKITIEQLIQQGEKGDIDAKLRHACERDSYKQLSESLARNEEELKQIDQKMKQMIKVRDILKQRIKGGIFKIDDLDIPKIQHHYYE